MAFKLFVVHGMGDHEAGWSSKTMQALEAAFKDHGLSSTFASVKVVEVVYSDVFSRYIDDWREEGSEIWPLLEGVSAEEVIAYAGRLKVPAKPGFLLTHAADVVLYHTCPQVRRMTLVGLIDKVVSEVKPGDQWGILAHSLGTSVAHDALHQLWNTQEQFGNVLPKASFVFQVANVSRALEWAADVYLSHVKPAPRSDRRTACVRYVDVHHKWDPFPMVRPFRPEGWQGFQEIGVDHWADLNVHGFSHYLDHPQVHCALIRRICDYEGAVSKTSERDATRAYLASAALPVPDQISQITRISAATKSIGSGLGAWQQLWEAMR